MLDEAIAAILRMLVSVLRVLVEVILEWILFRVGQVTLYILSFGRLRVRPTHMGILIPVGVLGFFVLGALIVTLSKIFGGETP